MVGNRVRVKIVKNKIAPPFKEAEFDIMFGKGISREGDILDLAANVEIVKKSGAWYAYNGDKIGQGRENAKLYLAGHPDVMSEIEEKVRQHYQVSGTPKEEGKDAEDGKSTEEKKSTEDKKDAEDRKTTKAPKKDAEKGADS